MKQTIRTVKNQKIVKRTHCSALPKSVGFPIKMEGVVLNLKTGKYERH